MLGLKLNHVSKRGPSCFVVNSLRPSEACMRPWSNITASDNGLSPGQHQAIFWTSVVIWVIGPLGMNFSEIQIKIQAFSSKKMHLKMPSGKRQPLCLSLNVLNETATEKDMLQMALSHYSIRICAKVNWSIYIIMSQGPFCVCAWPMRDNVVSHWLGTSTERSLMS